MPLTNEGHLRTALDALFYKDTILAKVRAIDLPKLKAHLAAKDGENDHDYLDRVCEWISTRFSGYSISHVHGRFRSESLLTAQAAASLLDGGGKYLVDETTAVVRFIFPCGKPTEKAPPLSSEHFDDFGVSRGDSGVEEEADRIRWFFGMLFVQSIVQVVNGEDEIWMVESGLRNRLHVWRVVEGT